MLRCLANWDRLCTVQWCSRPQIAHFQVLVLWIGTRPQSTRRHQPNFIYSHVVDTVKLLTQHEIWPWFKSFHLVKEMKMMTMVKKEFQKNPCKGTEQCTYVSLPGCTLHQERAGLLCPLRHYLKKASGCVNTTATAAWTHWLFLVCVLKGPFAISAQI